MIPFNNMLLYIPLRIVSFRVKVLVVQIMFLSNGIFRSQSRGRLNRLGFAMNVTSRPNYPILSSAL